METVKQTKKETLLVIDKNTVALLAVFMLLFLTSSFVITNNIFSSALTIVLWIFTCTIILFCTKQVFISQIILALSLLFLMLISTIFNDENIRNMFAVAFSIFTVFLYVETFDFDAFRKSYIKVLRFLCVASLICFFLYLLIPSLNNIFVVKNAAGYKFSCLIFYVNLSNQFRNCGMFWEPGAFQTFIGLALLLEISSKKPQVKNIILFLLTLITTFSTTGYIAAIVICLLLFLNKKDDNKKIKKIVMLLLVVVFLFIYLNQDLFFATNKHTVFGKLTIFFNNKNSGDVNSASIRFNAISKPMQVFFNYPIFGVGYEGLRNATYTYTHGMNTCTFVNWFAVYGIFFGIIMFIGYINFSKKLSQNITQTIIVLIALFILTMSENYVNNAFIILLALYGYKDTIKGNKYENITN